jgi:hypothetical protein
MNILKYPQKARFGEQNGNWTGGKTILICKKCGKEFTRKKSQTDRLYCSQLCYWKSNIGFKNKKTKGKNHWNWKGDNLKYSSVHEWISIKKGKPTKCEHCGVSGKKVRGRWPEGRWNIEWANINHTYHRILKDYIALCRPCHKKYDLKYNNL